ncbi:MAG: hypothetical protein M3R61_01275, partial [Chloroflexota bacterium]|nr:hypothetical protein [Chloroflexota bacterium]
LGLSALVKLLTLPLLAVYWRYLLRARGARELITSTALLALIVFALYAPFWYGPELLEMQLRLLGNVADAGPSLARMLLYTIFMAGVLWVGLSRDGRVDTMLAGWNTGDGAVCAVGDQAWLFLVSDDPDRRGEPGGRTAHHADCCAFFVCLIPAECVGQRIQRGRTIADAV